jgi:hypothetical protein
MRLKKRRPRRRPFALWNWFDAVRFQDVAYRLVGHLVPDVVQGVGDPVTPRRVLAGQLQNSIDDFLRCRRQAHRTTFVAVVPLFCDEFPMPTQNGVRREEAADLLQYFASQDLPFNGQTATLIVIDKIRFFPFFSRSTSMIVR